MRDKINFSKLIYEFSEIKINKQSEEIKYFYNRFTEYYASGQRHNYSEISSIIYDGDDETIELMAFNAKELYSMSKEDGSDYINQFGKLLDHINLAIYQKNFILGLVHRTRDDNNRLKEEINNTRKTLSDNIRRSKRQISELGLQKSKLYSEFTVVLGIFSAIIFATFGGLEILDNILDALRHVSTSKLLVFSSLSIGAVISLLFILLNGLSRITGHNFSNCGCDSKEYCCHTFFTKHPAIMIIVFLLIYIAGIGAFGYIVDYEEILDLFDIFSINGNGSKLLFLIYLLIFPIAFVYSYVHFRKKDQKKNRSS